MNDTGEMREEQRETQRVLKSTAWKTVDFTQTDQSLGVPAPPVAKPFEENGHRVRLPGPDEWSIPAKDLEEAIRERRSRRNYSADCLVVDELAFLLWATQGIRGAATDVRAFRTVPSAGCRHPLETYVAVLNVDGLESGIHRYIPMSHELGFEFGVEDLPEKLAHAALGQRFCGKAAAVFIWTSIPYRTEWRYGEAARKLVLLDAGHVCQNLYLSCEAIGAGTCAIAAYDQDALDDLLRLDGVNEFGVYLAPVGRVME